jgi:zinc ribbon protein
MAEAPARYCSNCGHELSPQDQLCSNCGTLHPSAQKVRSAKFVPRNSHLAYKDSPFGGCAAPHKAATLPSLRNGAGVSLTPAPH